MSIVTRFPPSPTGFMHIGNARTALYNWLYARKNGGKFLLRIEDTDRKRHSEEAVAAIMRGLEWLELDYDGEVVSQFANQERHREVAMQLLEDGHAYWCYATPEELEEMRATMKAEGRINAYDRRWRDKDGSDMPADAPKVLRLKAPLEGSMTLHDTVQGDVTVENAQLDDFVLLRSDGTPTYMLSVVVDDYDMGVTHVLRGDDHLNNAFRQMVIYHAMGWELPVYGHMPMIVGNDGKKFSKRHGATSVEDYKEMGYLPEAMRNYLLRLGWGHGNEEIIPTARALEIFDLKGIGKSPSQFDFDKLDNLNAHYIKQMNNMKLLDLIVPFLDRELSNIGNLRIMQSMDELKSRAKTLCQIAEEAAFYNKTVPLDIDEKAQALIEENKDILQDMRDAFAGMGDFTADAIKNICKNLTDGKLGKAGMPLRAALTGRTVSPSIFDAAAILGRDETLKRLNAALEAC